MRPLRRSRARFPLLSPTVTSSPGAGEVFPQRESQGLRLVAKALGEMRKFPAVLLALPLGELSPQVTERAHAVRLVAKASGAMTKYMGVLLPLPLGEVASPQAMAERAHAVCPVTKASGAMRNFPALPKGVPLGGAGALAPEGVCSSETEGVKKHPRRLTPTGVLLCCYVPCTPKGTVTQA